jgi:hypothetical protein
LKNLIVTCIRGKNESIVGMLLFLDLYSLGNSISELIVNALTIFSNRPLVGLKTISNNNNSEESNFTWKTYGEIANKVYSLFFALIEGIITYSDTLLRPFR